MAKDDVESRFARIVRDEGLLTGDQPVVLAVSGGVDSMVLLYLCQRLTQAESRLPALHIAHLNHQLRRQDSDLDAEFVQQQARQLRLPCTVEVKDVAERARAESVSIELAARQCRYEFFERLCLRLGARVVVLAHQADDHVETVLQRMIRGTGIRGLGGIRRIRPICDGSDIRLYRPLLDFRRAEIERYAADQQVPFRNDRTNENDTYTRNRIRRELLPLLRSRFNPQVDEAVLRLAEQARSLEAYLSETGSRMLESIVIEHNDRQLVLHSPSLARKPRVIQTQLLREAILRIGVGEGEITFGHLSSLIELASSDEGTKELHLPGGLRVLRRYSRLTFERPGIAAPVTADYDETCVSTQEVTRLPRFGMELQVETLDADETLIVAHLHDHAYREQCSYEEWIDADAVKPPLVARSRRPGDRFFPLGMYSMKKLSDFLIDEKIDTGERERLVVLCDQLGPIWVVPLRIDERVRLTRMTRRVLRLIARPIEPHHG